MSVRSMIECGIVVLLSAVATYGAFYAFPLVVAASVLVGLRAAERDSA